MKITKKEDKTVITARTTDSKEKDRTWRWWLAPNQRDLIAQTLSTASFIKTAQTNRYRQAGLFAKLYGNKNLYSFAGPTINKVDSATGMPVDRPTFNLIQSATDTIVARLSQSRPQPLFLTSNGDFTLRKLSNQLTEFVGGEFYQTKTYDKVTTMLRDCIVLGTGCLKVLRTEDNKVGLERVLPTEILIDESEALYGEPRQLFQVKLVDRQVLAGIASRAVADKASNAWVDDSGQATSSIADLVMVVEAWHLPSYKGATDGRHTIVCDGGIIIDEKWEKDSFPFVFLHYSPRLLGFWAQGLAEQLMGTQIEINSILFTISRSMKLVGVPRVFIEEGSRISPAAFNSDIGAIIKYSNTMPTIETFAPVHQQLFEQLQQLIERGYQQCGVSPLQAAAQKPAGLNSGEAIRSYDDIQTDRMSTLSRAYDTIFIDLAKKMVDLACEIAKETGKYETIYPMKDKIREIDLPKAEMLKNPFIVQIYNESSLPREPSARMQHVVEMTQAGIIDLKEARRLLRYPDIEQIDKLDTAAEERLLQILDEIVEKGEYTAPDSFMDIQLGLQLTQKYINLYETIDLEEEKMEMLRTFFAQLQTLLQAATPPSPAPQMSGPTANPQPLPNSPLVPNGGAPGAT